MSSGVIIPDLASLERLYQGADTGASLAKSIGTGLLTGEDINNSIRAGLLNAGLNQGKIQPQQLSTGDRALLSAQNINAAGFGGQSIGQALKSNPIGPHTSGGGFLGAIGSMLGDVGKAVGEGASVVGANLYGPVQAIGQAPVGLFDLAKNALIRSNPIIANNPGAPQTVSGSQELKAMARSTVHDFTNVTPTTVWKPIMDIASVTAPGVGTVAKAGSLADSASTAARAVEAGAATASDVGRLRASVGAMPGVQRLAQATRPLYEMRPTELQYRPDVVAQEALGQSRVPSATVYPSVAPFRRAVVDPAVNALFKSPIGKLRLPWGDTSLSDARVNYHIGKAIDATRGQQQAGTADVALTQIRKIQAALDGLQKESLSEKDFMMRKDATIMRMRLLAGTETKGEALPILEQYQKDYLQGDIAKLPDELGRGSNLRASLGIQEQDQARNLRNQLFSEPAFRDYFGNPTEAMTGYARALHEDAARGLAQEGLDPWEHMQNMLATQSAARQASVDQLLGAMPESFKRSGTLAKGLSQLQEALVEAKGEDVPEEHLNGQLAAAIPGGNIAQKTKIIEDAVASFKADFHDEVPVWERVRNADYLPGKTLTEKVGQGLQREGLMSPYEAQRFMAGSPILKPGEEWAPTYWPSRSASDMQMMNNTGRIARIKKVLGGGQWRDPEDMSLREFKQGRFRRSATTPAQLVHRQQLGFVQTPSFMRDIDHTIFQQGIERLDEKVIYQHIISRERHVLGTQLGEPVLDRMSYKAADGSVARYTDWNAFVKDIGSEQAAKYYSPLPDQSIRSLMVAENHATIDAVEALKKATVQGGLTPEGAESMNEGMEESAQFAARELIDEAGQGFRVVPVNAYNRLVSHAKLSVGSTNPMMKLEATFIGKWRHAVLSMMPAWWFRTTVGHGLILWMNGVNPLPGASWEARLARQGEEGFHVGAMGLEEARQIHYPSGVIQGALESQYEDAHGLSRYGIAPRVQSAVHSTMNFQRKVAFIHTLDKVARGRWSEIANTLDESGQVFRKFDSPERINELVLNHNDIVQHTLNEMSRMTYTFGQMAPWERRVAMYVMPFWGWYKFATKFAWQLPITYPGRANILRMLGQLGNEEQNQQYGPLPDWLQNSLVLGMNSQGMARYVNMQGLNPIADVMSPVGRDGQFSTSNLINFGQLNPFVQAGIAAVGINPMTGGQEYVDPSSGWIEINGTYYNTDPNNPREAQTLAGVDPVQRFIGSLARSFPEVRIPETLFTGGRSVYPESIPFISEKIVPTQVPKVANIGSALGQYALPFLPRQYNLGSYQTNLQTNVNRALSTYYTDLAKQAALNP